MNGMDKTKHKKAYTIAIFALLLAIASYNVSSELSNIVPANSTGGGAWTINFSTNNLYPSQRIFATTYWNNQSQPMILDFVYKNETSNIIMNLTLYINNTEVDRVFDGLAASTIRAERIYYFIPQYSSYKITNTSSGISSSVGWLEHNITFTPSTINNNYSNTTYNNYTNTSGSNLTNETVGAWHVDAKNFTSNAIQCTGSPAQYSRLTVNGLECFNDATGTGTVTSISQGSGIILTPNPIVTTGTIGYDPNFDYPNFTVQNNLINWNNTGNSGYDNLFIQNNGTNIWQNNSISNLQSVDSTQNDSITTIQNVDLGQNSTINTKEGNISSGVSPQFWGWTKSFVNITIAYVQSLQGVLDAMNTTDSNLWGTKANISNISGWVRSNVSNSTSGNITYDSTNGIFNFKTVVCNNGVTDKLLSDGTNISCGSDQNSGGSGITNITANPYNLNLSNGTSGNVSINRLAGGTGASATTYFRGDNIWATPSGGSGLPYIQLTTTVNITNTSNIYNQIFNVSIASNTTVSLVFRLIQNTSVVGIGIQNKVNVTSNRTTGFCHFETQTTNLLRVYNNIQLSTNSNDTGVTAGISTVMTPNVIECTAYNNDTVARHLQVYSQMHAAGGKAWTYPGSYYTISTYP